MRDIRAALVAPLLFATTRQPILDDYVTVVFIHMSLIQSASEMHDSAFCTMPRLLKHA